MSKRLLFITRSRLSENNGGANATKGFIRCFASLFEDCSIIYPGTDDDGDAIPQNVKRFPYRDDRSKVRKGIDVYRGIICANNPVVRKHLKAHGYDIIVIDNSFSGSSLTSEIKATGAKVITIHHNVERDYQHDNRKEYSISFRLPYLHYAIKSEREWLLNSDVNITLTPKDAATFQSWHKDKDLHLHTWGVCEYRPIADKTFEPKGDNLTFAITGSLCFMQSLHPIMEFVSRYWPLLKSLYPAARLIIAGRNPADILLGECSRQQDISVIPNPDDIGAVIRSANYYICPINAGSGLKLRLLDGFKQGLPVLCHEVSAAGYERMTESGCLFVYHDEQTFSAALQRMVNAQNAAADIYQLFRQQFSTENATNRLQTILKEEHLL